MALFGGWQTTAPRTWADEARGASPLARSLGSLVIIPAATAKHLARSLREMLAISVAVAVLSTLAGELIARRLGRPSGPVIIVIAGSLFLLSLPVRRVR